jgi:3',5'-cyclic AMP phosphodiesterase CpdA
MVLLAQVSDFHIDGGDARAARAERVMGYLAGLPRPVDAVLVTGDVADHGAVAEYEAARRLLSAPAPVLVCPGNHDRRANFRRVLLGDPGGDGDRPVNQVHQLDGLTVLLCDSTVPGQGGGYLADETIAWLDAALAAAPDQPAVVAMHHPPVALGIPFIDTIRQEGGHRLQDVLRRHRQVVAVLCGHAHTAASTWFAGRQLLVAPGVASTLLLPAERPADDVLDDRLPPAVAFHLLDDGRLTTHFRVVA